MPKRTPKACARHGCRNYAEIGSYCTEHQPVRVDDRPPAHERGYGHNHHQQREIWLRGHPVCVTCGKSFASRWMVMHHKDGNSHNNDDANKETKCFWCHERHHGRAK